MGISKKIKAVGGKVIARADGETALQKISDTMKEHGANEAILNLMSTKFDIIKILEEWGFEDIDAGCVGNSFVHATMRDQQSRVIDIVLSLGIKFPEQSYKWHQQIQREMFGIQWPDELNFDIPNIELSPERKLVHLKTFIIAALQNNGWQMKHFPDPAWAILSDPKGNQVQLLLYPLLANNKSTWQTESAH